jgi:exo-beta-1,3-glucanase (GH17 family)
MKWTGWAIMFIRFFPILGGQSSHDSLQNQIGQMSAKYGELFDKFIITETGWPSAGEYSPAGQSVDNRQRQRICGLFCKHAMLG